MSELARSVEEVLTRLVETLPESVATLERGPADALGPEWCEVGDLWRQVFTNPLRRTRKRVYAYDPYD